MINSMSVAGVEGENTPITFNELGVAYISASQSTILKVDKIRHDAITSFLQFFFFFFFFFFLTFFMVKTIRVPSCGFFSGQHTTNTTKTYCERQVSK